MTDEPAALCAQQLETGYRYQQFGPELEPGEKIALKLEGLDDAFPQDLEGLRVLDVGCNLGFFAFEAARRGAAQAVGVDVDARRLAWCERFRAASAEAGRAWAQRVRFVSELDAVEGKFSLVLCMSVLHHLMVELGVEGAVRRVASFVAPGGSLVYEGPLDSSDYIVRRLLLDLRAGQVEAALDACFAGWRHVGPARHVSNREVLVAWK